MATQKPKKSATKTARKRTADPAGPGLDELKFSIESAFERRTALTLDEINGSTRPLVERVVGGLETGEFRVAEPDGQGGHWLKVDRKLSEAAGVAAGDVVTLEIAPVAQEPVPEVPADLRKALSAAAPKAREGWADITPAARRDFIHWITSGKRAETRVKRIETACDVLAKGKRRPCCFDRSGMFDKSLSCPVAAPLEDDDVSRARQP